MFAYTYASELDPDCCGIDIRKGVKEIGMKYSEFRRWLKKQGCTFETREGGTSHMIVRYKGKQTSFPMHGSKEIGTGLVQAIKKQLGLK